MATLNPCWRGVGERESLFRRAGSIAAGRRGGDNPQNSGQDRALPAGVS